MLVPYALAVLMAGSTLGVFPVIQETKPASEKAPQRAPVANSNDAILSTWLLIENDNEIALAEIAKERAQDPAVRQFAETMIRDHRAMGDALRPFASESYTRKAGKVAPVDSKLPVDSKPTTAREPGETPLPRPDKADKVEKTTKTEVDNARDVATDRVTRDGAAIVAPADHVALLEELGVQCLESSRKMLESKRGADFDKAYVGMAVGGHMKALDHITVFRRHASAPLATVLSEGERKVATHLEHAKTLCEKMTGEPVKAEPVDRR